ncbi:hypothetical protein Hanom_Chr05g00405231 [Helianthus anomalus]
MSHFRCQINKHRYHQLEFATLPPGMVTGVATKGGIRATGTSDAYRHLPDSPMDEGTSQPTSGYTDDSEGIFIFKAQSEEPFSPKKRGWFSREK